MDKPDLTTQLFRDFRLINPLMIASSHLTSNEAALRNLARIGPSAITLKTTSTVVGGTGKGGRLKVSVFDVDQNVVGLYSDGTKDVEFLNLDATKELIAQAKELLPATLLGISILLHPNENYETLAQELPPCDYAEFNLKYSLRTDVDASERSYIERARQQWESVKRELERFIKAFGKTPILVKLPRELDSFIPSQEWSLLWRTLYDANVSGARIGILVANTLRCRIAPMFHDANFKGRFFSELSQGVLCGPALFLNTYDMVRRICQPGIAWEGVPVVATGGITTVQTILDVMSAGARAVQLCAALDIHSYEYYIWLTNQLSEVMKRSRITSMSKLQDTLHKERDLRVSVVKAKASDLSRGYPAYVREFFDERRDDIKQLISTSIRESATLSDTKVSTLISLRTAEQFALPLFTREGQREANYAELTLKIVSNTGQLGVHALLTKLAKHRNQVYPTSTDTMLALARERFPWDLTAISYAQAVRTTVEHPNDPSSPVFLGFLADDAFKVIATHTDATRIKRLYQFGGVSSQQVASFAIKDFPSVTPEVLNPSALSYLIFTWPDDTAILLKEPLASIYGLLATRTIQVLKTYSTPMCLLGSVNFVSTRPGDIPKVYAALRHLLQAAIDDPGDFTATLFSFRVEEDLLRFILPPKDRIR
jgi:dihydroorotate dehydrogenase